MARALDELDGETVDSDGSSAGDGAGRGTAQSMALEEALTGIKVRVWAELGRTQLGLSRALGLPLGSVVELDHPADAPVDLYVNGLRFAQGHLIVTDDGEWAFQCDTVGGRAVPDTSPRQDARRRDLRTTTFDEAPEVVTADEALESLGGADEPPDPDVAGSGRHRRRHHVRETPAEPATPPTRRRSAD